MRTLYFVQTMQKVPYYVQRGLLLRFVDDLQFSELRDPYQHIFSTTLCDLKAWSNSDEAVHRCQLSMFRSFSSFFKCAASVFLTMQASPKPGLTARRASHHQRWKGTARPGRRAASFLYVLWNQNAILAQDTLFGLSAHHFYLLLSPENEI